MFPLFLLFAIMPIIEIYVLMEVGAALGAGVTILIVLLTAAAGASLVRSQGLSTLMNVQSRLNKGEIPALQIMEGVLLAVAGVLLVTPGFVTDIFGLLILFPLTRQMMAKALMARVKVNSVGAQGGFGAQFGQGPFGGQGPFAGNDPFSGQDGRTFDHEGETHRPMQPEKQIEKESTIIDGDYQRKD